MDNSEKTETVKDFIRELSKYPNDWPVKVATPAGGGIAVEHREIMGSPVIAIFGRNGGRFGESPLTEEEYKQQSELFMLMRSGGHRYTSVHGDHRLYVSTGRASDTCYGTHFDRRIVERMVADGLIHKSDVDIDRVRKCGG